MKQLITILLLIAAAQAQATYRKHGSALLPDAQFTPGATRDVTVEQLCAATTHTRDARSVTASQKRQVCKLYGITKNCDGAHYEIDHLISLELGGSNDTSNLWPQPIKSAKQKDGLENWMHHQVCKGWMPLSAAQREIAVDWYDLFLYVRGAR